MQPDSGVRDNPSGQLCLHIRRLRSAQYSGLDVRRTPCVFAAVPFIGFSSNYRVWYAKPAHECCRRLQERGRWLGVSSSPGSVVPVALPRLLRLIYFVLLCIKDHMLSIVTVHKDSVERCLRVLCQLELVTAQPACP